MGNAHPSMKTSVSPIQGLENITEEDWKECKGEKGQGHGGTLSCWHAWPLPS